MNTMKWLVRREFWEHKGMFFWAPLCVAAALLLFLGATFGYGIGGGVFESRFIVNGHGVNLATVFERMPAEGKQQLVGMLAGGYLAVSAPLFAVFAVVAFFYCLGALYEERRDRSILFWKSLPLSDQMTVLSKVATAIVLAPLITIGIATVTALALLLIACGALAASGVNVFGMVLANPALYLTPLQLVGLLPVYILWALPTVGWLLLVSAWARSKVFLWAVGTPLIAIVIVKWADHLFGVRTNVEWFAANVVARALGGLFPGTWLAHANVEPGTLIDPATRMLDLSSVFVSSWMTLAGPGVWIGALAGAAMLVGAMRVRRWKDEG